MPKSAHHLNAHKPADVHLSGHHVGLIMRHYSLPPGMPLDERLAMILERYFTVDWACSQVYNAVRDSMMSDTYRAPKLARTYDPRRKGLHFDNIRADK